MDASTPPHVHAVTRDRARADHAPDRRSRVPSLRARLQPGLGARRREGRRAGSAEDQGASDTAPDTATFSHLAAPGFLHGPGNPYISLVRVRYDSATMASSTERSILSRSETYRHPTPVACGPSSLSCWSYRPMPSSR
jgi:hypothetical protein